MSLTFSCLNIKVDDNQNIKYIDKLFSFRKSQLTIAKKTKLLEEFIATKILFKINEINDYPFLIKFKLEQLFIYCNKDFKINEINNIIEFINLIYNYKNKCEFIIFKVKENEYLINNYKSIIFKEKSKKYIENNCNSKNIKNIKKMNNDDEQEDSDEEDDNIEDVDEEEDDTENIINNNIDENDEIEEEEENDDDDNDNDDDVDEIDDIDDVDDDVNDVNDAEEKIELIKPIIVKKKRGRKPKNPNEIKPTLNNLEYNLQKIYKDTKIYPIEKIAEERKKNIEIFIKLLKNKTMSRKIEFSIYNYSIDKSEFHEIFPSWKNNFYVAIYVNKSKSLYLNLDNSSYIGNNDFLTQIKKKTFDLKKIAYMKPQDMLPSLWQPIINENNRKEEIMKACENQASSTKFQCPNRNCRARKTIYNEVQTRSADEAMTLFITCLVCGKRWKQ
jgi:DNA-directed RNA polymerase subunit M/transcription elongation factor TFIIS